MYSNLIKENNIQSIIDELKENIANKVVERVKECYFTQEFSTVTMKDARDIIIKEINEYTQTKDLDCTSLIKKLIIELGSHYDNIYKDLLGEAIYNTDYQMAELERDEEHFFSRESLLSEIPTYNEKLRNKVVKANMLNIKYVNDVDQGIYVIDKRIKELDLSKDKFIKKLDFRILRHCRALNMIKLGSNLNDIANLEEIIKWHNLKIKIDYYNTSYIINEDIIAKIISFQNDYQDEFNSIFV